MNSNISIILACLLVLTATFSGVVAADSGVQYQQSTPDNNTTETGNQTASNNSTTNNTTSQQAPQTREGIMTVTQSEYISKAPSTDRGPNNETVYKVNGRYVWLTPQNYDVENVQEVYVSDDNVSVTVEESTGRLKVVSDAEGSYTITVQVQEEYQVGSVTETRIVRYETVIQVSNTDNQLVSASEMQETREKANLWDAHAGELKDIYGSGVDVVAQTNAAYEFHKFKSSPVQYALESPINTATLLLFTLGGWIILALGAIGVFLLLRYTARKVRREERMAGIRNAVEDMLADMEQHQIRQELAGTDVHEAYGSDHIGDVAMRALGNAKSVWEAVLFVLGLFDETLLMKDRLRIMGADGYKYQVNRNDSGNIVDVVVKKAGEFNIGASDFEDIEEEVIEWLALRSPKNHTVWEYDLRSAPEVDFDTEMELEYDVDTVVDELTDMILHGSEGKKRRMKLLVDLMDYVEKHPHTDDDKRINGVRFALSGLTQFTDYVSDRKGLPMFKVVSEHLYYVQDTYSDEREVGDAISQSESGTLGGSDD